MKSVCDRESYGLLLDANVPCGNAALGIGVPEYLVAALSRPALRQEHQHNNAVLLPRVLPHWNQRYTRDAQGRGPSETHPIDPSHSLFYLLYDYLIIEAWIMRAPLERLLELVHLDELAADILLLYLQATHPKLLIPTSAQFQGCSWDEAQQTLTLPLDVPPGTHPSLRLRLIHDRAPQQVTGAVLQPTAGVGIAYALCPGARQVIFQF
ncbi:MAG: hypothetical protein GX806_05600 [Lentisphaerae bacterium]|nr:hypothetical protein [Lentisphaerota bacterium]